MLGNREPICCCWKYCLTTFTAWIPALSRWKINGWSTMLPKHFQISRALASICLGVNVELEFIRIILHSDWGLIALGRLFDLPYFSGSRIKLRTAHLLRKTIRVISAMNFPSSYCIHYYEFIHKITSKSSSPILSVCSGWHSGSRQSRGSYPYRIRFCLFPYSSERMHLECTPSSIFPRE